MKFLYTPIPNFTDTTKAPPVAKLRSEKMGDKYVFNHLRILWSFWTGEGLIINDDDFSYENIAKIFSTLYDGEEYEVIFHVVKFMFENGYIAVREYDPNRDGISTYQMTYRGVA